MYQLQTDVPQRLLKISFSGHVDVEETRRCLEECKAAVTQMPQGFRCLADLSDVESMDRACAPFFAQAMDLFNEHGIGLVARVIPDPTKDIGLNILSLFHYRHEVRILTFDNLPEATQSLAR